MPPRADVWSYGGGVQTAALAVLIATGKLPRPEVVVMADTGREGTATWDYLRDVMAPYLAAVGLTVEVAGHDLATVDLWGKNGDLLVPAFTRQSGDLGMLPTLCSNEWKRRVVQRFLRAKGYGPARPVDLWLGISTDEAHRAKDSDVQWMGHRYPLLFDAPTNRGEAVALVARAGLPTPPKSACWMCPHKSARQWRELQREHPADFASAVALDADLRTRDADAYLHRAGLPLDDAVEQVRDDQGDLFGGCDSGYCWT